MSTFVDIRDIREITKYGRILRAKHVPRHFGILDKYKKSKSEKFLN